MKPEVLKGSKNKSSRRRDQNPRSWFLKTLSIKLGTVNREEVPSSEIDCEKVHIIVICCCCIGCRFCFDHCIERYAVCWEIHVGALAAVPWRWFREAHTLPIKPFPFYSYLTV